MSVLAIILARAGSKGVPGKNLAPLAGKPCLCWTLDDAAASTLTTDICLSADSDELLALARLSTSAMPIQQIIRPSELATDTARIDDAARHALHTSERRQGRTYEAVVILYGNVPLRPSGLIDRAITLLSESGCDSVQSYQPVGKHHPLWTARLSDSAQVLPYDPAPGAVLNAGIYRRQDLPPAYLPDGAVLCVTRQSLCDEYTPSAGPHAFFGTDRRGVINPHGSVIDIDEPRDLLVADVLLKARQAQLAASTTP